jgi:hypothetical protein
MRAILIAVTGALLASTGCATYSSYVPAGPGANGGPAMRYAIPPEAPQGEVYVTSFGFTDLDVGSGTPATLLHARMAVQNGSGQPWSVDGRRQLLVAPGYQAQTPAFANSDAGQGPLYVVGPGQSNVIDLYYAVAPPISSFGLQWSVDAAGHAVAQQTPFLRVDEAPRSYTPYPPYVVVGLGFGVGWWYGPHYPYRPHYPPVVRRYYYPPAYGHAGGWRGGGSYRGTAPGYYRATPPPGGWRGRPPAAAPAHPGGGWRGHPPPARHGIGGWRGR